MLRRFSINFAILSMMVDGLLVILGLITAHTLRPYLNFLPSVTQIVNSLNIPWYLHLVFALVWVGALMMFSVYDGRRNIGVTDELAALSWGSVMTMIMLAGVLYFSLRDVSRVEYLTFCVTTFIYLVVWHLSMRLFFRLMRGNVVNLRRVLIIGAGAVGRELQAKIMNNAYMGLQVVGFLDDDPQKLHQHDDILGTLDQINQVVGQHGIHDVVLALPSRAYRRVEQLIFQLHELPIKVWVIPDYFHLALYKAVIGEFAGLPLLDLRSPALSYYQRMIKRLFDLAFCALTLPFVLPVMGAIALVIWIDDRGPVFFSQLRVGENGTNFRMLKFRTMIQNAEELRHEVEKLDEDGNLIHKTPDDPRVTRIGRFLRRASLDELPQYFNILKGEMSVVGPRPEMPYLVHQYKLWQRVRFTVPQGITGWWQVNGRSDKPMYLNTEDDIYYVQNYSLWLDIQILIKTLFVVIRGKGAF